MNQLNIYERDPDVYSLYLKKLIVHFENFNVWQFYHDNYYPNCIEKSSLKLYKNETFSNALRMIAENRGLTFVPVSAVISKLSTVYQQILFYLG